MARGRGGFSMKVSSSRGGSSNLLDIERGSRYESRGIYERDGHGGVQVLGLQGHH